MVCNKKWCKLRVHFWYSTRLLGLLQRFLPKILKPSHRYVYIFSAFITFVFFAVFVFFVVYAIFIIKYLKFRGSSGARLLAGRPSGLLTSSFVPFGRSGQSQWFFPFLFLIQNLFWLFWHQPIYDTTLGSRDVAMWRCLWRSWKSSRNWDSSRLIWNCMLLSGTCTLVWQFNCFV